MVSFELGEPTIIKGGREGTALVRSTEDGWVGTARWDVASVGRVEVRGPLAADPEGLGGGEIYGGDIVTEVREGVAAADREYAIRDLAGLAYNHYLREVNEEKE